jgi:Fur family ferric uptake transcriptional regulator
MARKTRQRQAISDVFEGSTRPLSPREVLAAARKQIPQLGMATVYRAINKLLAEGWLKSVDLPGEAPRYELSGREHHHFFHCTDCGKAFEIECMGNKHFEAVNPEGFLLERHEVILYGKCRDCNR